MAEWGKGDPRWIVEERADGQNVNAWHWEEKDCSKWVRARCEDILVPELTFVNDELGFDVTVDKMSKFKGEVNWYNRKGKLFTLYDLEIHMPVTGHVKGTEVKGTIKIPEYEQDCEDEAEFRLSISTKGIDDVISFKKWARKEVREKFLDVWKQVIIDLHEYQKQKTPALAHKTGGAKMKLPEYKSSSDNLAETNKKKKTVSTPPGTVTFAYTFQASPEDLWDLLTNAKKIEYVSQSKVMMDSKEGGFFKLYDETITGCFLELKPYTEMKFAWRLKDWNPGTNSTVHIKFLKSKEGTKLTLVQTNVPGNDVPRTKEGWKRYYFDRWKGIFGYRYD